MTSVPRSGGIRTSQRLAERLRRSSGRSFRAMLPTIGTAGISAALGASAQRGLTLFTGQAGCTDAIRARSSAMTSSTTPVSRGEVVTHRPRTTAVTKDDVDPGASRRRLSVRSLAPPRT